MKKLDEVGLFWLGAEPEHRVHGALLFDQETGGRLRLDGLLGRKGRPEGYLRILGETQEGGYTLARCFETHRRGSFGSNAAGVSAWSVGEVYSNVHFGVEDEIAFDTVVVELEDMTSWIEASGIRASGWDGVDGHLAASVEGRWLEAQTISAEFGELVLLHRIEQRSKAPREVTLWQTFGVKIKTPELTCKPDLLEIVSDVQDLVSMGIDRLSAYTKIKFGHPDVTREIRGVGHSRIEIEHLARWRIAEGTYDDPPRQIAFSYEDLGGADGLREWLSLASRHRRTLARIMSVKETGMYSEDRLLNAVAAAEGLHRELTAPSSGKGPALKTRLIELAELAGPSFETAVVDLDKWSEFLKEERHEHAHNRTQQPSTSIDHYWHMANSVYWLIMLCFLSQIPTARPAIERATKSAGFGWMAGEIRAIMYRI